MILLVTRSVLSTFKREQFPNPEKTAILFLNVQVLVRKCPELEAKMVLLEPPKKPKRRLSTPPQRQNQANIKRRRNSTFTQTTSQVNDDELDPCLDTPINETSVETHDQNSDDSTDPSILNHYLSPESRHSTSSETHVQPNLERTQNSTSRIDNDEFTITSLSDQNNDDFLEPLVYYSSSSSELDEQQHQPETSPVNTSRNDLAEQISLGLQNLHKILARRHSLAGEKTGNYSFFIGVTKNVKLDRTCAKHVTI